MKRSTSVCYSLNDLTSDAFAELDLNEDNLPSKSNPLFNNVNVMNVLIIRAYSTSVYTFSYANYRKNNISTLVRRKPISNK
jgi:hypothetical protein